MPRSRRRHHSRSRSRSHSHDMDREPKRRKVESPHHKRSVSSEPESIKNVDDDDQQQQELATTITNSDKTDTQNVFKENSTSSSEDNISNEEGNTIESIEDTDENMDDSIKNNTPNKAALKAEDLKITPKRVLSPMQLQKKLESEKKRQEKLLHLEERKRRKLEMKEEKERQKNEEKEKILEEKRKLNEERLRLKQEKEEQKMKEKLAKQEEKDKKRREKEEKDELKKKELEEKNKEKQKLEDKKQKTAAAFVNFFVTKKTVDNNEDRKSEDSSKFMPFEVKSDMRLAPINRRSFESQDDKLKFDEDLQKQDSTTKLYLDEVKEGERQIGKCGRTWSPSEVEQNDDVVFVEAIVGETIEEQKPKLEKMRAKFFKFQENQRPPYFGTWKKRSKTVQPRKPFAHDDIFNYEVDSDEEWEEKGEGESLKGTDDEDEKENESDNEYEVDNELFVPHAYLSEDEMNDEENARLSPSAHKAKLKLLKCEFDEEMKLQTQKLKPKVIGCIWYDKNKTNVEEAIDRYLQPFAMICNVRIKIKKRSEIAQASTTKATKLLEKEHVPLFLKFIHGSVNKRKNIIKYFMEHMEGDGVHLGVSKVSLGKQLKTFAQWKKCPDEGSMHNKMCWYVNEDVRKQYNVVLAVSDQAQKMKGVTTK